MMGFPFGGVVSFSFLFIALIFIVTGLLQWLWNITMPQVFNLKQITYWQAFRILIISGILFGGTSVH
ncbi:MAG: hypothetical protein PWP31_727 [Clostridia bacterium]|nr:hypothetical protein [Clostridia bacterium]